ncbi:MAG: ABC transporter permease [Bacilli bacterium]|nr:ABC transporter permease [Bacilli bacterium]
MRMLNFAKRNFKELIRDPLSLVFEIVLPLFLLFIFKQINIPGDTYKLENFTPGIIIFGFSFITLFTATLIAKDRSSSLLIRLGTSPMKSSDYILGYILSLMPIIIIQDILFFVVAILLGLSFSVNIVYTILISLIISILFIGLGILIGSLVSEKATGGIGSIIVQLVCFTSGMYFSKDLIGKGFAKVCEFLPFESSLNIIKGILNNNFDIISTRNIVVFSIYTVLVLIISVIVFKKKMVSDNKN